jgi:inner membrane protein
MVLPGHLAGGYLVAYAFINLTHASSLPPVQVGILYAIGMLAGEGPDMDLLFFYREYAKQKIHKISSHREYMTHAPIFWLASSAAIILCGIVSSSPFISSAGWIALGGSFSHLIFDSIEDGIRWLWPISDRWFYLIKASHKDGIDAQKGTFAYYWKYIFHVYIRHWTLYAEISIVIVAILVAIKG